jgi:hypothetical protein
MGTKKDTKGKINYGIKGKNKEFTLNLNFKIGSRRPLITHSYTKETNESRIR